MSAFACMYFQEPSLAQFQLRMEKDLHKNNLRTSLGLRIFLKTVNSETLLMPFPVNY